MGIPSNVVSHDYGYCIQILLTSKPTNKNRLVTIVNWELYQSEEDKLTNKLTNDRQADDKWGTENVAYLMNEIRGLEVPRYYCC